MFVGLIIVIVILVLFGFGYFLGHLKDETNDEEERKCIHTGDW